MNPDKFQQAWRTQASHTRVTIDTDLLLQEMRRSHRRFESVIFWRDLREVAISLILLPVWLVLGSAMELPWSWYLAVPVQLWTIGYTLVDRRHHSRRPAEPGAPLLESAQQALAQVEHQMQLLRNVGWWNLLPLGTAIMAFFVDISWRASDDWLEFCLMVAGLGTFLVVLYAGIWYLNQQAVRLQFEPRRDELQKLIASLEDDGTSVVSQEVVDMVFAVSDPPACSNVNWNHVIPNWRTAAVIILPTLCGGAGGLLLPINELGPVFFQSVVSAVVLFEIALGIVWVRGYRRHRALSSEAAADQQVTNPPWGPAIVIICLLLVLSCLAVLALYSFYDEEMRPGAVQTEAVQTEVEQSASVAAEAEPLRNVSSFDEADTAHLDQWLQNITDSTYPSLSVAVVRDDEIVYRGSFGFADLEEERPATSQSQYNISGVTKVFTATLAAMLHERGVIDLDAPVIDFLPADVSLSTTPDVGATITLRHLAAHTSGLPKPVTADVQSIDDWYQLEPQRLYNLLANVSLDFEPGTAKQYSNLGYGLLGHVLERAADQPFDRLMRELICEPLQLTRTTVWSDDTIQPVTGYTRGTHTIRTESFRRRLAGSGGLVGSVDDLAAFLIEQTNPKVLSPETLARLHTETLLADGSPSTTALGWHVTSFGQFNRFLTQNGALQNCSSWIGFSQRSRVGVVVVTNCGGPWVDLIGYRVLLNSIPLARQLPAESPDP